MQPRWVTIPRAAYLTGFTVEALSRFIRDAQWPEGIVWREAPDGNRTRVVNLENYDLWASGRLGSALQRKRPSRSPSPSAAALAASA